jgi:sialidase-1
MFLESRQRLNRTIIALFLSAVAVAAAPQQVEVFRSGEGGYHTYRIPALIATQKGTLLAFCEGRVNSASDTGNIDILLRRSFDNGKTWQPVQKVADFGDDTIGNPTPVIERSTGAILLLLTSNPGKASEDQITSDTSYRAARAVWISRSTDDGKSWTAPVEITSTTKLPGWTWYATGPGNGIQMRSGRLLIPCDHNRRSDNIQFSHVIYSDDRGETWKIGGTADVLTNECAIVETKDGGLLLNMRGYQKKSRRAIQRSSDGGLTWSALTLDNALIEPVCQASMISAVGPGKKLNGQLLFSNPASTKRRNMTVRLSPDDGRTWTASKVIHEGPAAYSSLTMLRNGTAGLLYERGDRHPYERITFTNFKLTWLKSH